MFENVDEFLLCRPYVGIWALFVGRFDPYMIWSKNKNDSIRNQQVDPYTIRYDTIQNEKLFNSKWKMIWFVTKRDLKVKQKTNYLYRDMDGLASISIRSRDSTPNFQEICMNRHLVSVDATPVPVDKLRRDSVGDMKSAIFEKNDETTITKHSLYSPGESV